MVMREALGPSGSHSAKGLSNLSLPEATSRMMAAALKLLVMLWTEKREST
jgi:hypothetical protein